MRHPRGDVAFGVTRPRRQASSLQRLGCVPAEQAVARDLGRKKRVPQGGKVRGSGYETVLTDIADRRGRVAELGHHLACAVWFVPRIAERLERQPCDFLIEDPLQLDVRGDKRNAVAGHEY